MRGQTGTPIPRRENETKGSELSPMITYHMTPEEIAEKYGPPVVKKGPPKFELTKEEYLAKRMAGKSRRDIMLESCGNDGPVLKGFLSAWGLLDPSVEREEIDKLCPPEERPAPKPSSQKPKGGTGKPRGKASKYNITKEMVEAAFGRGKTIRQIEEENGMSSNSLFYYLKKWGLRSPNGSQSASRSRKQSADHVPSRTKVSAAVEFTPEEIRLLKVLRSAIDKVVSLYG